MNELVTLEIPAKAEYVVLGRLALAGLVRERRFSADAVADLKLALTEACTNSIRHAYDHEQRPGPPVASRCSADRVVLIVRDQGGGFHDDDVDCPECTRGRASSSPRAAWASPSSAPWSTSSASTTRQAGGTILMLTKLCDA